MMNLRLQKANDDKVTKDSQIRSLKDELMHQDELIEKLQREKKNNSDGRQKIDEDIQAAEDKANHLNRVKGKLEQVSNRSATVSTVSTISIYHLYHQLYQLYKL